jgi:hypothetical protein
MQVTGCAYEKPSRISQALVICFSLAVVVMATWFVATIMFSNYGTSAALDDAEIVPTMPTHVENVLPEPDKSSVTERLNSVYFEPLSRDYAYTTAAPPRSALPLAPAAESSPAATRDPGYPAVSGATAVPDADYRGIPTDGPPLRAEALIETPDATNVMPLPPPKRSRAASIPMPRPRPRLEADDVQPAQTAAPEQAQSLFDFLMYGPR